MMGNDVINSGMLLASACHCFICRQSRMKVRRLDQAGAKVRAVRVRKIAG